MNHEPKLFNRGFSLRQAFTITNLVILVVGLLFTLILLGVVLKSSRGEVTMRLANEAEASRYKVDKIFQSARETVRDMTEALPLLMDLDEKKFREWSNRDFATVLAANPAQFDIYFALASKPAQKIFHKPGAVYLVAKKPELLDSPRFNDPETFIQSFYEDPAYQKAPQEAWYQNALDHQEVVFTPFYFDATYLKKVMISVTKASRDPRTGEIIGVSGVDLTAKSFARLLSGIKIGRTGGVLITTLDGRPIAPFLDRDIPLIGSKYDPTFEFRSHFETIVPNAPSLPLDPGLHEVRGRDGNQYLLESRKLSERPFYVVAYQRKTDAYSELYGTIALMVGLATLFLFISLHVRNVLAGFVIGNIDKILANIGENRERFSHPERHPESLHMKPQGPKEVAKITHQLNLLYARLRASFAEAHLERDRAELATKTKSRFLSVMSHEIRTPLNSMLGLTDVLLLSSLTRDQERHLRVLQRSGQSLLRILNDILDFSRLEAGKLEIEAHEFELHELLYDVESLMRYDAEAKGLEFVVDVPSGNDCLFGDSIRIRQALLNLVGNAIKFTKVGRVEIRVVALEGENYRFEVIDTGIGISTEQKTKVFSEFSQADASITRRYGGTGLGLSICQNIIKLLGGILDLESEALNGTTFSFTIPLPLRGKSPGNYADFEKKFIQTSIAMPRKNPLPREDQGVKTHSLLVVDDDEDNHSLIEAYCALIPGVHSTHVLSGIQAIAKVKNETFDLILMDMQMPEMDGLEATTEIRRLQTQGTISTCPIIILSANTFPDDQQKSVAAGADEHVGKPIKLEDFRAMLKRWFREA
ncbi:MAG: response regulator [Cryobacterium sp.]|nr:response regulator [Oligoflexia bacterium]